MAILVASTALFFSLLLCLAFVPFIAGSSPAGIAWNIAEHAKPKFIEQLCRAGRQTFSIFGNRNPLMQHAQYALGRALFRQHRYLESISCLAELANSKSDDSFDLQTQLDMRYFLACDYWYDKNYSMSAQRFAEAAELASKAGKNLKFKFEIAKWRIRALLRSAQWNEADAIAGQTKQLICQSDKTDRKLEAELSSLFNDVLVSESRYEELDESLQKSLNSFAMKKSGDGAIARTEQRLGWTNLMRHHYEEAIRHFNKTLKIKPDEGNALWNRGICYDLLNQSELAYQDYSKYLTTSAYKNSGDNFRKREVVQFKKYCESDYFAGLKN